MEESTITFLGGLAEYEKSMEYIAKSQEAQRFLYYSNHIGPFHTYTVKETATHVYWSEAKHTPRLNGGKLFYTKNGISGITLEKKTRNINLWFGKMPQHLLISSFYAYCNYEVINQLPNLFSNYNTVSLLKDVAKRKIKTIEDYSMHLTKRSLMFKGADPEKISRLIYSMHLYASMYYIVSLDFLSSFLKLSEDIDKAIDFLLAGHHNVYYDIEGVIRSAKALNEPIYIIDGVTLSQEKTRLAALYKKSFELHLPKLQSESHLDDLIPF